MDVGQAEGGGKRARLETSPLDPALTQRPHAEQTFFLRPAGGRFTRQAEHLVRASSQGMRHPTLLIEEISRRRPFVSESFQGFRAADEQDGTLQTVLLRQLAVCLDAAITDEHQPYVALVEVRLQPSQVRSNEVAEP